MYWNYWIQSCHTGDPSANVLWCTNIYIFLNIPTYLPSIFGMFNEKVQQKSFQQNLKLVIKRCCDRQIYRKCTPLPNYRSALFIKVQLAIK